MKSFTPLFLSLVLLSPLSAESWSAEVGLGALLTPGTWVPLVLSAPPGAAWTAEVVAVSASGRETGAVVYPHSAGGRFEDTVFLADSTRSLKLRFVSEGLVREEMVLPLAERLFPGHLVAVWNVTPEVQGALADVLLPREPARTVTVPPARWPVTPLSFGGISALVGPDPGAVLSPAQLRAVRAWISSGGRLVVLEAKTRGSLLDQIGPVPGFGMMSAAESNADWKKLLALAPYGQSPRLGTDFEPSARGLAALGSAASPFVMGFAVAWGALIALVLVLRKKRSLVWAMGSGAACSVLAAALGAAGLFEWDRGLPVHGREIVLPGGLGRFVSVEAMPSTLRQGPFDWYEASPWALDLWKRGLDPSMGVLKPGDDRLGLVSFLPAVPRPNRYRIQFEGALRWSELSKGAWIRLEEAPAEFGPDQPWLTKLAQSHPGQTWSVGLDAGSCWLRPELGVTL